MKKLIFYVLTALLIVGFSAVTPASACVSPGGDAWLYVHGDGTAWLVIHGGRTISHTPSNALQPVVCTAALNLFPGVVEVTNAEIADAATGEILTSFAFEASPTLSKKMSEIAPAFGKGVPGLTPVTQWRAFEAKVTDPIEGGREIELMFDVVLDRSLPIMDSVVYLNSQGAYISGAVNSDGVPVAGHFSIQRPHEVGILFENDEVLAAAAEGVER